MILLGWSYQGARPPAACGGVDLGGLRILYREARAGGASRDLIADQIACLKTCESFVPGNPASQTPVDRALEWTGLHLAQIHQKLELLHGWQQFTLACRIPPGPSCMHKGSWLRNRAAQLGAAQAQQDRIRDGLVALFMPFRDIPVRFRNAPSRIDVDLLDRSDPARSRIADLEQTLRTHGAGLLPACQMLLAGPFPALGFTDLETLT